MQLARQENASSRPGVLAIGLRALLSVFGLLVLVSAAYVVFVRVTTNSVHPQVFIIPIVTIIPFTLGWLIDRKHPGHRIALLFLVMAYSAALMIIMEAIRLLAEAQPDLLSPAAESIFHVLAESLWIPGVFIPLLLFPLFFPNGKLLSPRWRPVAVLVVISMIWMIIASALRPWPWPEYGILDTRPLNGIPGSEPFFDAAYVVHSFLTIPVFLLAIFSGFLRYRRSQGVEREQMKWPILALLVFIGLILVRLLIPELETLEVAWGYPMTWAMAMLFPISIGIAILRQGLWDIDVVISRTLIYGGLSAVIAAMYIAIVGILGLLFQTQTNAFSGLIAAVIIALLFQPLRDRLQHKVNRLLYGERDDPAAVLTQLAQQVETADSPAAILPNLVQTIAHTLKIPYVAILLPTGEDRFEPAAIWGESPENVELIPLTYQSEEIGQLALSPRDANEQFERRERQLLISIAALTANTVRAVQLSDELRLSRRRIVAAREDERRRLRRDLHDGLGPQLASQTLGLEAVAQLMPADQEKAQALLDSLKAQAEEATLDIRRIVYDLRPPALDDLGLTGALRQSAARYESGQLQFTFDVPQRLPDLPAAVETAVYRIAQEAMTNVVRHAQATLCTVRLFSTEGNFIVEVEDNGRGLAADQRPGVGLQAMKERAAELNGQLTLQSQPGSGTLVQARLPLEANGA